MNWQVAFTPAAARQIAALPDDIRVRIRKAIGDRLPVEPKAHLLPLSGPLRAYGKFRVGPLSPDLPPRRCAVASSREQGGSSARRLPVIT